jgi:hypothetical protein
MSFVRIGALPGKLYLPERIGPADAKHPCPDCEGCQFCSDARCAACRDQESCQESESEESPG